MKRMQRPLALIALALLLVGATEAFLAPALLVGEDLRDPALGGPGVPARALALHRSLAERLPRWARERIASGVAETVPLHNVPETEWPSFSCVFFLNATDELKQQGVDVAYADDAVHAARDLLMDPANHSWVRRHWGDDYLVRENLFFRSLLIAGLTSYIAITDDRRDEAFLREQVESLAAELDASPHGLLQDYPGETYPIDVLAGVAYIREADRVLGTDHRSFVTRARRAFVSPYDDEHGLVRFRVDLPRDGSFPRRLQGSRGIGNSWVGIFAAELWPEDARRWYAAHEQDYWQEHAWAHGFREFPVEEEYGEWTYEVDAGPIVDGFGTSASAFGLGAARRMGRFDHAYTLTAQMSAASWPTLDGALLVPQEFSDAHAPLLGECALAYFMVLQPAEGMPIVSGGTTPLLVWLCLGVYLVLFAGCVLLAWRAFRLRADLRHGVWLVPFAVALLLAGFDLYVATFMLALGAWLMARSATKSLAQRTRALP